MFMSSFCDFMDCYTFLEWRHFLSFPEHLFIDEKSGSGGLWCCRLEKIYGLKGTGLGGS
jgi:hypothetical protein